MYNTFSGNVANLYNKNCPIGTNKVKGKNSRVDKSKPYSTEFIKNGNIVRGDKNIANGPNKCFADTVPALANNIPKTDDVFTQYLSVNVNDTMFIEPVTEEEILCLVHNAKSKRSQ